MLRRRLAALVLAALPVACTAQITPPSSTIPGSGGATPAPSADTAPASPGTQATPSAPAPAAGAVASQKITYSSCHVDGQYIAMTFDDGPHATNTPRLLDMLKQRNIKATFFMVGQCAAEYPQIVKRIAAEGHEVASHSWSHPLLSKMGDEAVREQLRKTHDAIVNACGVAPKIMRPPYGGFTERQRRWCFGEFGYKVILWDVDPLDWKIRNAASVEKQILQHTVPGSIILSHDIHKSTIDAMPATLDALLAKGYKFVTVSELIAMDRPVAPKPKAPAKGAPKSTTPTTPANPTQPSIPENPAPAPAPAPEAAPAPAPAPVPAPAPAPAPTSTTKAAPAGAPAAAPATAVR